MMRLAVTAVFLVAALCTTPAFTQGVPPDKPAENMQTLRDRIRTDKEGVVAENMQLTESEAKSFWPVYQAYQKDLAAINKRTATMIRGYADALNTKSMDNIRADKLISDYLTLQRDEVRLMQSYVVRLHNVLPSIKIARYLQIENKIRAIIQFEAAAEIPAIPGN